VGPTSQAVVTNHAGRLLCLSPVGRRMNCLRHCATVVDSIAVTQGDLGRRAQGPEDLPKRVQSVSDHTRNPRDERYLIVC